MVQSDKLIISFFSSILIDFRRMEIGNKFHFDCCENYLRDNYQVLDSHKHVINRPQNYHLALVFSYNVSTSLHDFIC